MAHFRQALHSGGLAHARSLPALLFRLLACKPQFALVIPIAPIAGGCWRATVAASLTVVATIAVTVIAFGVDPWLAFIASTEASRKLPLEPRRRRI